MLDSGKKLARSLYDRTALHELGLEEAMGLAQVTRLRTMQAGDMIHRQGTRGEGNDSIYLITEVHVTLQLRIRGAIERTLTTLSTGDLFGGLPLLADLPHCESAVADTQVRLLEVDHAAFAQLPSMKPWLGHRLGVALLRVNAQRMPTASDSPAKPSGSGMLRAPLGRGGRRAHNPRQQAFMQDRLVFLIGSPRSGSTLLSRVLGAHPAIFAPEEPHLITPIAHLGYFDSVESAPYDPIITRAAARQLVAALPGGESEYLTGLRAYTDAIYRGLFEGGSAAGAAQAKLLLDKTPAYALSLDFLSRLYPEARYIVLTRHPIAVWSSFVDSFFDGEDRVAHQHNPLLERYVPAIARFLRTTTVPHHRVQYENFVQEPEANSREICAFLGIDFEPSMVDYGASPDARGESTRGLGDPTGVARQSRPTTTSLSKWVRAAAGKPERVGLYREILARLADEDLETWGFSRTQIEGEIEAIDLEGKPAAPAPLSRYTLERKLLVAVRKRIQPDNALGRLVRKLREVCDVLLR